jgi:hypothetical protein
MIDLIYSQDAGQRPDVIITDTGSYSDIVFALLGRRAAALQDGSVDVLDDSGATIATLAAPWARDAISIPAGSRSRPRSRVTSPTASRRSR